MAKGDIHAKIDARVQEFVADMTELIRESAFEAVREAIEGAKGAAAPAARTAARTAAPARRGAKKKASRKRTSSGRRVRRSEEEIAQLGETFLQYVKQNPGQRLEEIGEGLHMDTADLKRPVTNLMEAGELRTEGQRRGTKYFAGKGAPRKKASKKAVGRRKAARK